MRYPTGFTRQVLWGGTILVCVVLAASFKGRGMVADWLILSALVYWHVAGAHHKG